MGTLKVDKIVSTTGDATSAPITLSGDTATIANATLTTPTIANLSNVSGALPSGVDVKTAGGQGFVFLATVTGSNVSALSLDGYFTSAYTHYKYIYSIYANTSNTDTYIRFRQSNADLTDAYYRYSETAGYHDVNNSTATTNHLSDWDGTYIKISSGDNSDDPANPVTGELMFCNVLSSSIRKTCTWQSIGYNSPTPPSGVRDWSGAGWYSNSTAAMSGLTFSYDGGNISGNIQLYGIRNS
jgi:hypothetical protein